MLSNYDRQVIVDKAYQDCYKSAGMPEMLKAHRTGMQDRVDQRKAMKNPGEVTINKSDASAGKARLAADAAGIPRNNQHTYQQNR